LAAFTVNIAESNFRHTQEDLAIFDCKLGQAVLIEPGLPPQSPENGNIPAYGRRTFRNFRL